MVGTKLCDACQAFLRGSWDVTKRAKDIFGTFYIFYKHHNTAESFRSAIELECAICLRLQACFERGPIWCANKTEGIAVKPTNFRVTQDGRVQFRFGLDGFYTEYADLVLVPWSDIYERDDNIVSTNTGDEIALEFLINQHQRCLSQHPECCLPISRKNGFVPTRLVDVGYEANALVRICENEEQATVRGYVALSHCWGNRQPLKLTKSTAASFKEGLLVTSLPQTFQDAVKVTRKFRHRYLWIDSLCIIQDDVNDWRTEAATMCEVYNNAEFCIAATAAENCDAGLFVDRDFTNRSPVKVQIAWGNTPMNQHLVPDGEYSLSMDRTSMFSSVENAKLNLRAWVAQERYLSRRILHFAQDALYWECEHLLANELHPDGYASFNLVSYEHKGVLGLKRFLTAHKQRRDHHGSHNSKMTEPITYMLDLQALYGWWTEFRSFYTGCYLTNGNDVLAALHGIVQDVAEAMQDEMVAGLWKGRLIQELGWHTFLTGPRRPAPSWQGPSWSWISSRGHIGNSMGTSFLADSREMVTIEEVVAEQSQIGDVCQAFLVLRCRLMPTKFRPYCFPGQRDVKWCNPTDELSRCAIRVTLDDVSLITDDAVVVDCYLLVLRYEHRTDLSPQGDPIPCHAEGLVVVLHDRLSKSYQRIGSWRIIQGIMSDSFTRIDILPIYEAADEQIITLV